MNEPLVSVIIPVYNGEKFVEQAVRSVLAQPCRDDIEILIVNDGSTDRTGEVCDRLAAECPSVRVFHKENGGVAAARNFAIERAGGRYLAFLDADDEWAENFLDETLKDELSRPESADLYSFGYRKFSPDQCFYQDVFVQDEEIVSKEPNIENFNGLPHCTHLYKTDYTCRYNFRYLPTKTSEDTTFLTLCCTFAPYIKRINRCMLVYHTNLASCMHTTDRSTVFSETYRAFQICQSIMADNGVTYEIDRSMVSLMCEIIPYCCAFHSYRFVKEFTSGPDFHLLNESDVQPWKRYQKDLAAWRSGHRLALYLKYKIVKGIPLWAKRILFAIPFTKKIGISILYKYIWKWHEVK